VRAAFLRENVRDEASPALVAALAGPDKSKPEKPAKPAPRVPDDPFTAVTAHESGGDGGRKDLSTDDKLAVIWTFVTKESAAVTGVPHASQPDPDAGEIRVVDGRDFLPNPRNLVAKVRHLQ
jgi:hypothetical protein